MVKSAKGDTHFKFWSDARTAPKRQYKFLVTIPGFQPFLVTKCDRPSVKIGETPHKFLNHSFGSFDYSGEELLQLETTFRYDYAVVKSSNH